MLTVLVHLAHVCYNQKCNDQQRQEELSASPAVKGQGCFVGCGAHVRRRAAHDVERMDGELEPRRLELATLATTG